MACRAAGGGRTGDNQPHGRGVVLIFGGSVSPSASPPLGNGVRVTPALQTLARRRPTWLPGKGDGGRRPRRGLGGVPMVAV